MKSLTSREVLGSLSKGKIGGSVEKELRRTMGTGHTPIAKKKFARQISGKGEMGREKTYKKLGISQSIISKIEKALTAVKGPSREDQKALVKKSEMTRKINVFLSQQSAEEPVASYETTTGIFAGKTVETRTMTGGGNNSNDSNGKKFALGGSSSSSGPSFALGGKNSSNNNGKQSAPKNGSPFGPSSRSSRGALPGQGISPGQGNPANQGTPMPPRNPLI